MDKNEEDRNVLLMTTEFEKLLEVLHFCKDGEDYIFI
jgi:hypothetical protein